MSDAPARGAVIGFTAWHGASSGAVEAARAARRRVTDRFARLTTRSIVVGATTLDIWGPGAPDACLHRTADGSLLVLVGAPQPPVSWDELPSAYLEGNPSADVELPWEGRVVLLRIAPDGEQWTLWNDWLGAIPVFHAGGAAGRVASTLEPAVVAATGYGPADIRLASLLCILINGHLLSDWTFFRSMRTIPADSVAVWDPAYRHRIVGTVGPTRDRWESRWDDLVDEAHALATRAIAGALAAEPSWMLPLSGGLDSRLLASVSRDLGADVTTCAWGAADTVDVVCSRQVARSLDLPWRHVDLGTGYLAKWTRPWTEWFGSSMHVHGMYQMAFYDAVAPFDARPIASGFLNDVLCGGSGRQIEPARGQLYNEWYGHWTIEELRAVMRVPLDDALAELESEIEAQFREPPGAEYQRDALLEIRNRCPLFTSFQLTLADYWRGAATPFMNRAYARFWLSLPRVALDGKALLREVIKRRYPAVAAVPGTYGDEPLLRTGRYLLARRIAEALPPAWRVGPFKMFGAVDPRMDCDALRHAGRDGLWPIPEAERALSDWMDVSHIQPLYERTVSDDKDYRTLRRLQSVQTLAYRLIGS
ncbi:MAG: hypothetical protein IT177_01355 [Acidobacteria bacterium]|nr:hypothetical protein [Acidobacteriota bacterium]